VLGAFFIIKSHLGLQQTQFKGLVHPESLNPYIVKWFNPLVETPKFGLVLKKTLSRLLLK